MPDQLETKQSAVEGECSSDMTAFAADPEMIAEFVTESREHLGAIERGLLLIEKDSSDLESLNAVFRAMHTVKGLAGFLDLAAIQTISHEVETLLDHARSRRLVVTPTLVDALFECTDYLKVEIDRVQRRLAGESIDEAVNNTTLVLHLRAIAKGSMDLQAGATNQASEQQSTVQANQSDPVTQPLQGRSVPNTAEDNQPPAQLTDDRTVRIDTAKLDRLMDAVGELVIAQSLVGHNPHVAVIRDARLIGDLGLLQRITEEVQRVATSIRMVPVGIQFQKTARLVRDLSRQVGKQVALSTSGDETEVDKTIAEELAGPLLHMVRNSIDHGIEDRDERLCSGKNPMAQIRLAAYHRSSQIVIEISDDGRGLDRDRILAKATQRGLVKAAAQLSDSEIYQLIFEPGFSTAERLTDISGRGVGMDVVRRHVQRLRGRIEIQTEAGIGTTFLLKLPLTLAVIEGLVVTVGDNRYIVPVAAVHEIFCPSESQLYGERSTAEESSVEESVSLRGDELPVVRLHRRFGLMPRSGALIDGVLIVMESRGRRFCLFIDEILGKQEVVVKALGKTFKDAGELMGCAILSDGRVGLILDADGLMP